MTIGPTFKPQFFLVGRKHIQKRSVTNGHQKHSGFSHCTATLYHLCLKDTKNKPTGYIPGTCRF